MSDDWKVGDLAVCVDDGPCCCGRCDGTPVPGLEKGKTYGVIAVSSEPGGDFLQYSPEWLDWPHVNGWAGAHRFARIRPDEHQACEPEFITLLKRTKVSA